MKTKCVRTIWGWRTGKKDLMNERKKERTNKWAMQLRRKGSHIPQKALTQNFCHRSKEWLNSEEHSLINHEDQNLVPTTCVTADVPAKACNPSPKKSKDDRIPRLAGVQPTTEIMNSARASASGGGEWCLLPLLTSKGPLKWATTRVCAHYTQSLLNRDVVLFWSLHFVCETECHVCAVPTEASRGHRIPRAGVMGHHVSAGNWTWGLCKSSSFLNRQL